MCSAKQADRSAIRTAVRSTFVTQWFLPEPVRIPFSIADSLRARGHTVEIVTGVPNFPDGKVHTGYRSWRVAREDIDGFAVNRTPLYPSHDSSAMKRVANYVSWAVSSTLFGWPSLWRADVALVYSSPATAALAPALWRRLTRTPFVLIIQDLWPDSVFATGMVATGRASRVGRWFLNRFVDWTYRAAAHIIVISPGMLALLEKRGVSRSKMSLIYNWAEEGPPITAASRAEARAELGITANSFVVTYAGTQGRAQGLDTLIDAASALRQDQEIVFVLAGDGIEAANLRDRARRLGCANIQFLGQVPQAQMRSIRAASDLQLVSLIDDPLFSVTMPSKLQSILESGSPALAIAPGDAAKVVVDAGAGWATNPGDASALVLAIKEAKSTSPERLREIGNAGRNHYYSQMSCEVGATRLDEVLRDACSQSSTHNTKECAR